MPGNELTLIWMRGMLAICGFVSVFLIVSTFKFLGLRRTAKGFLLNIKLLFRSVGPVVLLLMCAIVLLLSPWLLKIPSTIAPFHVLVPVAAAVCCIIYLVLPPIALVLEVSSDQLGGLTLARIVGVFRPLKTVSLLRPDTMPRHSDTGPFWWRYRTVFAAQWEDQVLGLLKSVAFVFADIRCTTPHVVRELKLIEEAKPPGTILFILSDSGVSELVKDYIENLLSMNEVIRVMRRPQSQEYRFHIGVPESLQRIARAWIQNKIPDRPKIYAESEDDSQKLGAALRKDAAHPGSL